MHDEFSNYKTELDRLRLTEESKRALASSLANRRAEPARKPPRRLAGTFRLAVTIAAVVCLLATAGYAAVTAAPTLMDRIFEGGAAYDQSSAFIGKSVDNNGWTVTITDCVGDDRNLYLGLDLTAPEGTVLDDTNGSSYTFGKDSVDFTINFFNQRSGRGWSLRQIPDEDPTDNHLAFVLSINSLFNVLNGSRIGLVLPELCYSFWNEEEERIDYMPVCKGKWNFGVMTISYPDSTIRLKPDLPVTTLDVEAVITEVEVSPMSVHVRIEGDALKGHHSWVPKNARDGWYGCIEYQEIVLNFDDGSSFVVDEADSNLAGSECSGGTNTSEDGYLVLNRTYSANINGVSNKLIDIEHVTSISICGVEIPLR